MYEYVIRTSLKQFLEALGKIIEETWAAATAERLETLSRTPPATGSPVVATGQAVPVLA